VGEVITTCSSTKELIYQPNVHIFWLAWTLDSAIKCYSSVVSTQSSHIIKEFFGEPMNAEIKQIWEVELQGSN